MTNDASTPFNADEKIAATVILPASVWDRLTEDDKGLDREAWDEPEMPDLPLSVRIGLFLQSETARWCERAGQLGWSDPDDDPPF